MKTKFFNEIQDGKAFLSGIDTVTVKVGYYGEECSDGVLFQLNGKNYLCYYDPEDGYRSTSRFFETTQKCKYTFPPQPVLVEQYDARYGEDFYGTSTHGIKIYNEQKELILWVGTDNYDDYYPVAIFEYYPENLPINKNNK